MSLEECIDGCKNLKGLLEYEAQILNKVPKNELMNYIKANAKYMREEYCSTCEYTTCYIKP